MPTEYIPHPRYGDKPRYTGLDPDPNSPGVFLHWNTGLLSHATQRELERLWKRSGGIGASPYATHTSPAIRGTAIAADITKQAPATVQVTHYYDIKKVCRNCSKEFIFFAEEQRYWYEDLQLPLEADCVRCFPCRRKEQLLQQIRARYQELLEIETRGAEVEAELAECRLTLIEEGIFHIRQLEKVRAFLNHYAADPRANEIRLRVVRLEENKG